MIPRRAALAALACIVSIGTVAMASGQTDSSTPVQSPAKAEGCKEAANLECSPSPAAKPADPVGTPGKSQTPAAKPVGSSQTGKGKGTHQASAPTAAPTKQGAARPAAAGQEASPAKDPAKPAATGGGSAPVPGPARMVMPGMQNDTPVAIVDGKPITMGEIDALASGALLDLRQKEYKTRREALENLVYGQLLSREAQMRGLTVDALIEAEISGKAPEPTPAEIDAFYAENKAQIAGMDKESVTPRIAEFLRSRKLGELQATYFKGLRGKYDVKILLEPPRLQVSVDDDASRGPADAPITIVEFSDYQCPYCSTAEETLKQVEKKYSGKVRVVYRDFPLSFHARAQAAAEASECAKEQGRFWEMHGQMFAHQDKLGEDDLTDLAKDAGLNKKKFKECLASGKYKDEVKKDMEDGTSYGVTGTPTFFVNGVTLAGAQDLGAFEEIINAELERLQ